MELAALILGIVGLLLSFIPGCGIVLGGIPAFVGLILGIIALVKKLPKKKFAIIGIVLDVVAVVVMIVSTVVVLVVLPAMGNAKISNEANKFFKDYNAQRTYDVGETYYGEDLNIKLVSCDKNFTGYSSAYIPSGYKVIKLEFNFKNKGDTSQYIASYKLNCIADDVTCSKFYSVADSSFSTSLSKGESKTVTAYFEVPRYADEIEVEYTVDYATDKKVTFEID